MKLEDADDPHAIYNDSSLGPAFGYGYDMYVNGSTLTLKPSIYQPGPLANGPFNIKEMEVFQVTGSTPLASIISSKRNQVKSTSQSTKKVIKFSSDINYAINAKYTCLNQAESEIFQLEESFKDEQTFIKKFVIGNAKDIVALNVSGTMMITTRSTLSAAEDSVLAQQFDSSKWTEQGCSAAGVKEWTPDQVNTWAKSIEGLPEDVSIMLYENEITGRELLAMNIDALKMMGFVRVGTVALLLKEIETLEKANEHIATFIAHSPYCFGKLLDYLRLKRLHLLGLTTKEPALPKVCDSQKERFEKIVKYYFPGDAAKFVLG
jgi:hypothetical protein